MKKAVLMLALYLLAPSLLFAQAKDGSLFMLYDVDSATLTYCTVQGQGGGPFAPPVPVQKKVTAAASTTLAETTVGTNPFFGIVVGDVLVLQTPTSTNPSATTIVAVTAKASDASVTVDTAITVTGVFFGFYHHLCGTTANDGWVSAGAGASRFALGVQYDQGDLDALVVRWECKAAGPTAQPVVLYPGETADCGIGGTLATDRCSFATPGTTARLTVVDTAPAWAACRVGVAFAAADASDATTAREKVTVTVSVR